MQEYKIFLCHGTKDFPLSVWNLFYQALQEIHYNGSTASRYVRFVLYEVGRDVLFECCPNLLFNQRLCIEGNNEVATGLGCRFTRRLGLRLGVNATAAHHDEQDGRGELCSEHVASEMWGGT